MAGLPWLAVFALIAWFAVARGWAWVYGLALFCMGVIAASGFGGVIAGLAQQLLSGAWSSVITLLNTALG